MASVLGLALSFAISFLSLGFMWIGSVRLLCTVPALLFLVLSYLFTLKAKVESQVLVMMFLGAAPIASLLVRFRNNEDSHLMPIAVVTSWVGVTLLGYRLALRQMRRTPPPPRPPLP